MSCTRTDSHKRTKLFYQSSFLEYYSGVLPKQAESNPESIHIHPAVKTLLQGKRPKLDSVDSFASDKPNFPTYLPPIKKEDPFVALPPRAFQHKQKRRIVVGNVSKWIPENQREGVATHKWMVYVRGDEENPDLPEVCRVRFYLHPSYKPHHEVDVDTPPWQLTRRGWGEFPLRVLIFFENNENKSIELVHQIKLDKTHSGTIQYILKLSLFPKVILISNWWKI